MESFEPPLFILFRFLFMKVLPLAGLFMIILGAYSKVVRKQPIKWVVGIGSVMMAIYVVLILFADP